MNFDNPGLPLLPFPLGSDQVLVLVWDTLVTFLMLAIFRFASTYMRGDPRKRQFFLNLLALALGLLLVSHGSSLAGSFFGWELVGVASFFLIGFFKNNARAVRNSFRAWCVYRVGDFFFLNAIALTFLHRPWPAALCLILATFPKSGIFPFSGWLYRAMEGPTPSSAIFYGSLSSHLGILLLLKFHSVWETQPYLPQFLVGIGLGSFLFSVLSGRTRPDVKTTIAFATQAQVALMVAELGLGGRWLVLAHLVAHAILRTWQLIRAATVIQQAHVLSPPGIAIERMLPRPLQERLYWFSVDAAHGNYLGSLVARASERAFLWPAESPLASWIKLMALAQLALILLPLAWFRSLDKELYLHYALLQGMAAALVALTISRIGEVQKAPHPSFMRHHSVEIHAPRWVHILLWSSLLALPGTYAYFLEDHLLDALWMHGHDGRVLALTELWFLITLWMGLAGTRIYLALLRGPGHRDDFLTAGEVPLVPLTKAGGEPDILVT